MAYTAPCYRENPNFTCKRKHMHTIIIQETDPGVLDVLTEALTIEGFDVLPILNVEEDFLQLIDLHRPHVVVLDYRLDGSM
ncbi:hypothetical protein SB724_19945, partial [Bacillus sp. SIMBA_031]|uniref:hypothetical protein n=1 Tax=Bacillus sp. SIMBA_031 TaxID=3085774 RepID=UPI003978CD07